jgi:hypothetical protein
MHVVAIAALATSIDTEATALAPDLGLTAYETRLLLVSGTPAIVRRTAEGTAAIDLAAKLRSRGHGVVVCDDSDVVPSSAMIGMRRPRIGSTALSLDDRAESVLPFDDVLAFIAARHRHRTETSKAMSERKFSPSRALISGGLVTTATVKSEAETATDVRQHVLYIFRRSGTTPWILRDAGSDWSGLGRPLAPTSIENFKLAVAILRERAPGAVYDERLLLRKATPERVATSGTAGSRTVKTSSAGGMDLLAHLLALFIARGGR